MDFEPFLWLTIVQFGRVHENPLDIKRICGKFPHILQCQWTCKKILSTVDLDGFTLLKITHKKII
jgi:hypothetical protein